jgi:hypothetical protein
MKTHLNTKYIAFPRHFYLRMLNNVLNRDGSLDISMPNVLLNLILKKIFGIEKYLLKFANLSFGVSILCSG